MEGPWANIKAGCRGSHHPIHIANGGGVLGGMGAPHIHFNFLFLEHRTNKCIFYDDGSDALETPYFQDSISSAGKEGAWGGG